MIAATHMKGLCVAIFGLGRSGIAAALSCLEGGARLVAWDDNEAARETARKNNIPLDDLRKFDFEDIDELVLAPGVPLTHPEPHWTVQKAQKANVPIIGDTELFVREISRQVAKPKLVAITGTNGKSTTTALIGHISAGSFPTQIGGNIGVPVLELEPFEKGGIYVVEFSSYQLDLTPSLKPDIALCLNLSPDHLERHGDMSQYAAVKEKIFENQEAGDFAIIGDDDAFCRKMGAHITKSEVIHISGYHETDGVNVLDSAIYEGSEKIADLGVLKPLLGKHNGQNIAASFAATQKLGLTRKEIITGLKTFPGLSHRMEFLGTLGEIDIINDSKATNTDAASMALSCLENIHWIVGGQAKEGGLSTLLQFAPRINHAYLIGSSSSEISKTFGDKIPHSLCENIEKAVKLSVENAMIENRKATLLLSPACASFDQYRNFEERGEDFRKQISTLEGFTTPGGAE